MVSALGCESISHSQPLKFTKKRNGFDLEAIIFFLLATIAFGGLAYGFFSRNFAIAFIGTIFLLITGVSLLENGAGLEHLLITGGTYSSVTGVFTYSFLNIAAPIGSTLWGIGYLMMGSAAVMFFYLMFLVWDERKQRA